MRNTCPGTDLQIHREILHYLQLMGYNNFVGYKLGCRQYFGCIDGSVNFQSRPGYSHWMPKTDFGPLRILINRLLEKNVKIRQSLKLSFFPE